MSETRFEPVVGWGAELPDLTTQDVSDISVDADDNVHLLYRNPSFVIVASPEGKKISSYGEGALGPRAHGITATEDLWYVVDEGQHRIRTFDPSGVEGQGFGSGPRNPNFASTVKGDFVDLIDRPYPPFTRPTRLTRSRREQLYVSDGYGNCCIHQFDLQGGLIRSWGSPGVGRGEFHIPHSVQVDSQDRVLVCDRENDRVQLFSDVGEFLDEWTDLQRPQAIAEVRGGFVVAEGAWRPGHVSRRLGAVESSPSRVTFLDSEGLVVSRFGGERADGHPGFIAAHGIAASTNGDIYIAEVSVSVSTYNPDQKLSGPTVSKFRRIP